MTKFLKKILPPFFLILSLQTVLFAQGEYQRAHLWEKEITAFAEIDKKEPFPTDGILFVGSSSIRGWRSLKEDFPGFRALNRGFGGSHLEDAVFYFDRIVSRYKPRLIVLYAGENDLVAGKSVERVFGDFQKFVSLVRRNLPKSRLIVISVKPSPARWNYTPKFQELNGLIKAETEKDRRLLFVDVWTPMLGADGEPKRDIFLGDRLHLNPEGYRIWRETLLPHVKSGAKGAFR